MPLLVEVKHTPRGLVGQLESGNEVNLSAPVPRVQFWKIEDHDWRGYSAAEVALKRKAMIRMQSFASMSDRFIQLGEYFRDSNGPGCGMVYNEYEEAN